MLETPGAGGSLHTGRQRLENHLGSKTHSLLIGFVIVLLPTRTLQN